MSRPPTGRVAVVIPFRNAAATLHEALESIAGQTLGDFECVLVDHESTDRSREIAADFAVRDRRFRLSRSRGSFVTALNHGVASTNAPLVARMDADDIADTERLEAQVRVLSGCPEVDLVSCLVESFPRESVGDGMKRYEAWINAIVSSDQIRASLFVESPIPHPSAVFRRSVFERAGGYAETDGPEDYDLWLRMLLSGSRAVKVPRTLLRWRDSPARMSRSDARYAKAMFFATKLRHFPSAVPRGAPLQIWGAGPTARRWARNLRDAGYEIRRFVDIIDDRVGRTVHGQTIEPPEALRREDGIVLAAVGLTGAREIIEDHLRGRGFLPVRDYIAVA